MANCPICSSEFRASDEKCATCGTHLGFPNVRAAAEQAEKEALAKRYEDAFFGAQARGADDQLRLFELAVSRSKAVVGMTLYRLRELVADGSQLYTNYYLAVRGMVRQAAQEEFDRHRRSVDAILFGSYAEQIGFAALTLNGSGLKSYGTYSVILRDITISKRSSLLEENSFTFVQEHGLKPGDRIPPGYQATWEDRQQLAVAKLADLIHSGSTENDFPDILLKVADTRNEDRFIEVHIFGQFNRNSIESVAGKTVCKRPDETAVAHALKEMLIEMGRAWIEE